MKIKQFNDLENYLLRQDAIFGVFDIYSIYYNFPQGAAMDSTGVFFEGSWSLAPFKEAYIVFLVVS